MAQIYDLRNAPLLLTPSGQVRRLKVSTQGVLSTVAVTGQADAPSFPYGVPVKTPLGVVRYLVVDDEGTPGLIDKVGQVLPTPIHVVINPNFYVDRDINGVLQDYDAGVDGWYLGFTWIDFGTSPSKGWLIKKRTGSDPGTPPTSVGASAPRDARAGLLYFPGKRGDLVTIDLFKQYGLSTTWEYSQSLQHVLGSS